MSDNWAVAVEEELLKRTHDLGTGVKECVDFRNLREMSLYSLLASVFGEGNGTPTPVLLPGKSHGRRSLVGCSPWGR